MRVKSSTRLNSKPTKSWREPHFTMGVNVGETMVVNVKCRRRTNVKCREGILRVCDTGRAAAGARTRSSLHNFLSNALLRAQTFTNPTCNLCPLNQLFNPRHLPVGANLVGCWAKMVARDGAREVPSCWWQECGAGTTVPRSANLGIRRRSVFGGSFF